MTARGEMEAVVEAILFVATEPIPSERLLAVFEDGERDEAMAALQSVLERHAAGEGRGLMIEEVGGGFRLVTRPELNGWLRRFYEASGGNKLSMAALETLAIIAYRQPMTGPEIQDLRGKSPAGVLKTLLERRLIRITGRKPVVGNPFLYGTTREFLMHFGLRSLKDLPPLEEFEETFGAELGSGGGASDGSSPDREEGILQESARLDEQETSESQDEREISESQDEHEIDRSIASEDEQEATGPAAEPSESPVEIL
ncbi:MAG: SMC-Scp complex subunit ScpB [Acidobacteriota bacterium]